MPDGNSQAAVCLFGGPQLPVSQQAARVAFVYNSTSLHFYLEKTILTSSSVHSASHFLHLVLRFGVFSANCCQLKG